MSPPSSSPRIDPMSRRVDGLARTISGARETLRLGILKLTDSAPVVMAQELGLFAEERLDVAIAVEPSWANIADKLAYGILDGAILLPPLAMAICLGLRGAASCPLVVPMSLSLGGNTVTLSAALADALPRGTLGKGPLAVAQALATLHALRRGGGSPTLAVVHAFSTHNLLLRYWLAAGGIDPERDLNLVIVPPARVVQAIQQGRIDGFCAGAPWGRVAERAGLGVTVATSHDIWRNGPEKIFAVRAAWAERHPETLQALLRALLRAARICDDPARASEIAATLSHERYLDMPAELLLSSLPGGGARASQTASVFFANAATFPWRSHALWTLREMARWGFIGADLDVSAAAHAIYRPDLYAIAAAAVGASVPVADRKTEGTHRGAWTIDARPSPITMGPDLFCDSLVFDPAALPLRVAAP
jgi:ABC-type nitrate/sulfonate/bicarbonate transport system substrate-binding protein